MKAQTQAKFSSPLSLISACHTIHPLLEATIRRHDPRERAAVEAALDACVKAAIDARFPAGHFIDVHMDAKGRVVDGRVNLEYCLAHGIKPRIIIVPERDVAMTIQSRNLGRALSRSLVAKALIKIEQAQPGFAAKYLPKDKVREKTTRGIIAAACEMSPRKIGEAQAALKTCPDVFEHLGERLEMKDVATIAKLPPQQQQDVLARMLEQPNLNPMIAYRRIRNEVRSQNLREIAGDKLYSVVLADPAWPFRDDGPGRRAAAENHYGTMSLDEIKALGTMLRPHLTDDASLFLWVPSCLLRYGMDVIEAWGFDDASGFVWVKDRMGMGSGVRNCHEFLLAGIRGNGVPRMDAAVRSDIHAAVREHSRKPEEAYEVIERLCGDQRRLEVFARGKARPGWDAWGNEVEHHDVEQQDIAVDEEDAA